MVVYESNMGHIRNIEALITLVTPCTTIPLASFLRHQQQHCFNLLKCFKQHISHYNFIHRLYRYVILDQTYKYGSSPWESIGNISTFRE